MHYKTSKRRQLIVSLLLMGVGGGMLLIIGCATSGNLPTANIKVSESKKAISVAKESNSGAEKFAEFKNAEDKLLLAKAAIADGEYLAATRLAEQATVDADYARIKSKADKTRKEADQMHQDMLNMGQNAEPISK
ncbi:MAG: DUF4398 domain-containing protein [Pseudomonadota bacterium]